MTRSGTAWKSTRRQREAIVTSSGGTSSARITNTVEAGGSSTVFSSGPPPRSEQVELVEDEHLATPSTGDERRPGDVLGLVLRDGRPHPVDLADVWVLARQGQPAVAAGRRPRVREQGGEGPGRLELPATGGPAER